MEEKKNLNGKEKFAYGTVPWKRHGLYAVRGLYPLLLSGYHGVSAIAMGIILLVARVFDAFNDPIMGVIVAKTKTKGQIPSVADDRNPYQCHHAISDVCSTAGIEWWWTRSICSRYIYLMGNDIHHDGYSLLVYDPGFHRSRKGT